MLTTLLKNSKLAAAAAAVVVVRNYTEKAGVAVTVLHLYSAGARSEPS
jgi:hypothetical protein